MSVTIMMSYALSRKAFPGKRILFFYVLITMYFNGGVIPTFLQLKNLNMLDNLFALMIFGCVSGFNLIMIKNAFQQIPRELEEAAEIDGASDLFILARVTLPLMKPILTTFTLFEIVRLWNDWYWPMLLLNKADKMTLQIVLRTVVIDSYDSNTGDTDRIFGAGIKMATIVLTILPIMCIYPYLQRYFVKGVMIGAVKG